MSTAIGTFDLRGKRAFVTGATSGIGLAIARAFAAAGATVAVHGRTAAKVEAAATSLSVGQSPALAVVADLSQPAEVERACDEIIGSWDGIDIVINNAGECETGSLASTTSNAWRQTFEVNVHSAFVITHKLVPSMIAAGRGGRVIFNSSISGKIPDPNTLAYCASKSALLGLMRCMAVELGEHGITVNALCPGWVDTPMAQRGVRRRWRADGGDFDSYYNRIVRADNLLNARVMPEDVAASALFLASDAGRFITGQALNVCAGSCFY